MPHGDNERVVLYYASRHTPSISDDGRHEPRWILVPEPHTRSENEVKAREKIEALMKHDEKYKNSIFKVVRVSD